MGLVNGIPGNRADDDYYTSADHLRAVKLGAARDVRQARQQGTAEGYNQGFDDGQQSGYDMGWNDGIERGNRELMKADDYIKGYLADKERLQAENERLLAQVQALQADNEVKAQECIERAWQTNRVAAVLNAMRSTLESLTADKESSHTAEIERLFLEQYKEQVATGLEKGYLRTPLEDDAIFIQTMPSMHRFLTSILQSVNLPKRAG